jgi:hypothetical protein
MFSQNAKLRNTYKHFYKHIYNRKNVYMFSQNAKLRNTYKHIYLISIIKLHLL